MKLFDHGLARSAASIPVTILTGFLGAGKTTLLNRILTGGHGLRVAVLVNDFGSINIDAELIVSVESNVVSLANGCICCSIREDLAQSVMDMINRPDRPEYMILEASGVAEPTGIMLTFMADFLRESVRLDSIICVVDAEQVLEVPELMELKIRQMALADMVILNKVDLVDRVQIERIKDWLDGRFHRYRLVEARHSDVPLEILLSAGRLDAAQEELTPRDHDAHACRDPHCLHRHHDHTDAFSTWSYETNRPLSLEALREAASRLPATIYRCKGVIHSLDVPERRAVLQVVGKRVEFATGAAWGDRERRTRIVVIGALGGIDEQELHGRFESCICASADDACE